MNWLAIIYDDRCGMCSRLRRWLEFQPVFVPLRLVPLHSPGLSLRFPGIEAFKPEDKLVVVSSDGSVWRGDGAWIMVLWALHEGRELAFKLSSPALRSLARRIVSSVSENRLNLSRWLGFWPDASGTEPTCTDGTCSMPPR